MSIPFDIDAYLKLYSINCMNNERPIKQKRDTRNDRESFHQSISKFLDYCNKNGGISLKITDICEMFGFQRRRFYDLASILQAFGIVQKVNMDMIQWVGMSNVQPTIDKIIQQRGIKQINPKNISGFFPSEQKLLMNSIGINFILLFVALKRQQLNLQETAKFFARDNGRFKSTLCKLYQVVYLLVELGIVERRKTPSEIFLADVYFKHFCQQMERPKLPIPIHIKPVEVAPRLDPIIEEPIDFFDFDMDYIIFQ